MQHECDEKCDCDLCEDEYNCGKQNTNGIICTSIGVSGWKIFVAPYQICDGVEDCYGGIDESNCTMEKSPSLRTCKVHGYSKIRHDIRVLNDQNSCAVPGTANKKLGSTELVCDDYKDQMNCTDDTIICEVQVSQLYLIN